MAAWWLAQADARPVRAQQARALAPCNGQRITNITVQTRPPLYGGLFARAPWLGRLATSLHTTTAPRVVANLILLHEGEPCSGLLRRETERLLRAQPYLADATLTIYADGPEAVRVEVVTVDEPAVIGSVGVSGKAPLVRALKAGSSNVRGLGVSAQAGWKDGGFYRDIWQARYSNFQLFKAPIQMHLTAVRRDLGYDAIGEVAYPFFTDLQPRAWRVAGGASEVLVPFRTSGAERLSLGVRRQFLDAGGVTRIGNPGHLAIVGGSITVERGNPSAESVVVTDTGLVLGDSPELRTRYDPFRSARVNLVLGYRLVNFLRVSGFEALAGVEDVRRGVQAAFTVGRGLPMNDAEKDEVFLTGSLYGGVGSAASFAGLEVLAEGRRVASGDWESILMSGRFGFYLRPHPRHTWMGNLEYSAGRRQWLPFQLTLGDLRGGVRGYEDAELGGAARLVARLEERWRFGNIRGTGDLGAAFFAEVGKLWAGDAPFGRTTGYLPSVGVALLSAVPPRSRRMWRLDFAVPLQRTAGARWGMRLTNEDRTRSFWNEPNDVRRNRERSGLVRAFVVP